MIEIEIIRDYKCCWKVGQRRAVMDHFAAVLVELGYAKVINEQNGEQRKQEKFKEGST